MLERHAARLRIVPSEQIHPHEIADPAREARIEQRLQDDGMLRDPVIAGHVAGIPGYVLLDGTNRQRALTNLGFPWIMAQILDYADPAAIELRSWAHAARMPAAPILEAAANVAGLVIEPLRPLAAAEMLADAQTAALVLEGGTRHRLRRVAQGADRAAPLRELVEIYEPVMRRIDAEPEQIEERAEALQGETLVAFPVLSRAQVVSLALDRNRIPAGITRHIIRQGRALRVNLPLDRLAGSDLEAANAEFDRYLETLNPRVYGEPTVLFDS